VALRGRLAIGNRRHGPGDAQRADGFSGPAQLGSQVHRVARVKEVLAAKRAATAANAIALRYAG
jgi:hypothetical protein